jgi:hypothetical protein
MFITFLTFDGVFSLTFDGALRKNDLSRQALKALGRVWTSAGKIRPKRGMSPALRRPRRETSVLRGLLRLEYRGRESNPHAPKGKGF